MRVLRRGYSANVLHLKKGSKVVGGLAATGTLGADGPRRHGQGVTVAPAALGRGHYYAHALRLDRRAAHVEGAAVAAAEAEPRPAGRAGANANKAAAMHGHSHAEQRAGQILGAPEVEPRSAA